MKSLRLAMIAHGIPVDQTHNVASALELESVDDLGGIKALRLAMIAHGIPADQTHGLASALELQSVDDVGALDVMKLYLVPVEYRNPVIDMRNFFKPGDATMWTYYVLDY